MRRIILFCYLFFISFFCFAQQNLPAKIIGNIPGSACDKKYQIQVGAYKIERNAEDAISRLKNIDLEPAVEKFRDFTRVLVKEIPANQVRICLANIAMAGFNEVIIREDVSSISLIPPGKREVPSAAPELLSKIWEIENCPNPEFIGYHLFILDDGTYYVTNHKGESSSLSNWRWNGDNGNKFEYTHNDWEYYGRAEITKLTKDSLELLDTGYSYNTRGRSSAGYNNRWVFSIVLTDAVSADLAP
jgi:hypothetical protein